MFDSPDLKLTGDLLVDGQVIVCRHCDDGLSLQLYKRGSRETWPAWLTCLHCGRGEDHPVITNGLVDAAVSSRTGREKAVDRDTFAAEWRGITITGECIPEFVLDDAVVVAQELAKVGKSEVRQRKNQAKKQARSWWRGQKKAAQNAAGQVTGTVKAAALTAAWDLQTGGAGPVKKPARRCRVKGCRKGWLTIQTRLHSTTGKTQETKVPCAVCRRAG